MGDDQQSSLNAGGGGGGPDASAGVLSNGEGSCCSAASETSGRKESSESMGPASAAANDAAEHDGADHSDPGDGTASSAGGDIPNCGHERLDRSSRCRDGDHDRVSDEEAESGRILDGDDPNGGGSNGRMPQGVRKIPPHSGVRVKFIVESLRMEMIHLQQQNAKLRRIVAMRLPDRSDAIFEDCCSVSAAKAVAARESFVQKMTQELTNLGVGNDDDDDDDEEDDDEEGIHLLYYENNQVNEADEAPTEDGEAAEQTVR
mmetsp:Transcript_23917/g.68707  ORF Transcript_23917/g.68707 Transcript_23917/m.68707 type:complete len:260 (-) Transcript_23917:84-863(-)|eukprot:CAMPEP_0181045940 /NCGR_PEP_ID=MMETSP1070-20121207/14081_1 /TAXON_ID=265543 /ORGANISM="Minutocellus polymorphus, Strain NH13" /LENGTH=259 /DNA_ID=CAMNT_0023124513 /DNA_START=411 /DNA_END=1190 /DNA_ORIENTATION=+